MSPNLTIVLVGDMTVAAYAERSVLQGWGAYIGRYLKAEVIQLSSTQI